MDTLFRLLGHLEVFQGCQLVPLVPLVRRRERCLLGILLIEAGATVTIERLINLLWDDDPPPAARASLYTHMARLRSAIPDIRLRSVDGGYLAEVDRSTVDCHQFQALASRAGATTDPRTRAALARQALRLWRGPVLAGDAPQRLRERVASSLTELRLTTMSLLCDAELAAGRHQELIGEATLLAAEHPYHERFAAQLMLALYRSGRQADALDAFQRARERLADHLGVDPGPDLRRLHTAILRADPALSVRVPAPPSQWRPQEVKL